MRRGPFPADRVAEPADAQDRDLAGGDHRGEEVDAEAAQRADREGAALEFGQGQRPSRAAWARLRVSAAIVDSGSWSARLRTGTIRPSSRATARPTLISGWTWIGVVVHRRVEARVLAQGQRGGPDHQVGDRRHRHPGLLPLFLELGPQRHRGVHDRVSAQRELGHLVQAGVHPGGDDAAHAGERDDAGPRPAGLAGRAFGGLAGRGGRTSERSTLPPGPVPATAARSTPAAVASRRTSGETVPWPGTPGAVAAASSTSAVMTRPPGPVPFSSVMSMSRSRATRRALGEENNRPVRAGAVAARRPACGPVAAGVPVAVRGGCFAAAVSAAAAGCPPPAAAGGSSPASRSQPIRAPGGSSAPDSTAGWNRPAPPPRPRRPPCRWPAAAAGRPA